MQAACLRRQPPRRRRGLVFALAGLAPFGVAGFGPIGPAFSQTPSPVTLHDMFGPDFADVLHPDQLTAAALVTVNPPVFLDRPQFAIDLMSGPANDMMPAWPGPTFVGPPVEQITCPERSRKSGIDLLTMTALAREALPLVKAPLLVVQSGQDIVVRRANAGKILARSGSSSKRVAWLHNSLHISQLDLDREEVVRLALDFVRSGSVPT
jgi:pimeloyl-ACP methyl ester carboxylesterase